MCEGHCRRSGKGPAPAAERAATTRGPPLTWPGSPSPSAEPPASWPGSWRRPHWPSSGPAAPCGLAPGSRGWQTRLVAGRQPPQPQPPEQPTPGPGSREAGTTQPGTGSTVQERACSACFPTASSCDGTCVSSRNFKGRVLVRIPTGLRFRWRSVLAALAHRAPSRRLGVGLQLDLEGSRCAERCQGPAPTPSADVCTPLSCLPGVRARGSRSLSRRSAFPFPLSLSCRALRTWPLLSPHDRERAPAPPGPGPAWDLALGSVLTRWPRG